MNAASVDPLDLYTTAHERRRRGEFAAARALLAEGLACDHVTPEQIYQRGAAKLLLDDWSGWSDYEIRKIAPFSASQLVPRARQICWTHRAWDGVEDLGDKTVLLVHEQGVGDAIQMLRYVPMLAEMAQAVVMIVSPRLVPLVQHNFGRLARIEIDGIDRPLQYDRYVWSMSLPALMGRLPPFIPLVAPRRQPPLPPRGKRARAGICWAGRPEHVMDAERSMALSAALPLLHHPEIEWISLQVGARAADAAAFPTLMQPPPLFTFADTADLMRELDFVVSVDTSVCHLAGALAIPTYLMLPSAGDARWGLRHTSDWYPTLRIVRQPVADDWNGAVHGVLALLDHDLESIGGTNGR